MATAYVSPYAPVPAPVVRKPQPAAVAAPNQSWLEPSPDSTIDVDPNDILIQTPVQPTSTTQNLTQSAKEIIADEGSDADCDGDLDLTRPAEPEPDTPIVNPVEVKRRRLKVVRKTEVDVTPSTTNGTPRRRQKKKRSASPELYLAAQPTKRKYTKRSARWKVKSADVDEIPAVVEGSDDEDTQVLKERLQVAEDEIAQVKAREEDAREERKTHIICAIAPLSSEEMMTIISDHFEKVLPTSVELNRLYNTQKDSKDRQKIKREKSYRAAFWVNESGDASLPTKSTSNGNGYGGSFEGQTQDYDSESQSPPSRSRRQAIAPSQATRRSARSPSLRTREPSKRNISSLNQKTVHPSPLAREVDQEESEAEPLWLPPPRDGLALENIEVGVLIKAPHNVVLAGFDPKGRLNWRATKFNFSGEDVGFPRGPATKRENTNLHPSFDEFLGSDNELRFEIYRRQKFLANRKAEKTQAASRRPI